MVDETWKCLKDCSTSLERLSALITSICRARIDHSEETLNDKKILRADDLGLKAGSARPGLWWPNNKITLKIKMVLSLGQSRKCNFNIQWLSENFNILTTCWTFNWEEYFINKIFYNQFDYQFHFDWENVEHNLKTKIWFNLTSKAMVPVPFLDRFLNYS